MRASSVVNGQSMVEPLALRAAYRTATSRSNVCWSGILRDKQRRPRTLPSTLLRTGLFAAFSPCHPAGGPRRPPATPGVCCPWTAVGHTRTSAGQRQIRNPYGPAPTFPCGRCNTRVATLPPHVWPRKVDPMRFYLRNAYNHINIPASKSCTIRNI